MYILVINPGSTSTKISVFNEEKEILNKNLVHSADELNNCKTLTDQYPIRKKSILSTLYESGYDINIFDAVVSRGGTFGYANGGAYLIEENLINACKKPLTNHASNLGALIAFDIASEIGVKAYIYDAICVNETEAIARVTGLCDVKRKPFSHVLNTRAVCMNVAQGKGKKYDELNFIAAHLGGGISLNLHKKGRIIDIVSDDEGPMSPERAGAINSTILASLCYSGKYTEKEMLRRLKGRGGLIEHLGTSSVLEVTEMIKNGNEKAKFILNAMAYQISKSIGALSTVVNGQVDYIILTGGVANCSILTDMITESVRFIAEVIVVPGEMEMQALARGVLRVLRGEENAQIYRP
jgi:butyrate kinase